MAKKKTGTYEWAPGGNVNIQTGCEHDCRYCYARDFAVKRFHRCTREQWRDPVINNKKVDRNYGKRNGVVMFPSTHDITPRNISEYLCVLKKLLDAGNQVLIVSKPHWSCIALICDQYRKYQEQIMFRFTIGSVDDYTLDFWEPNAPHCRERLRCLKHAHFKGYKTSVSCEPYLDSTIAALYERTSPFITDSFWVGKLRNFKSRVDLTDVPELSLIHYVEPLKAALTDEAVRSIYAQFKDRPLVRWKDSIRKVVGI
jgi:DNA repair photolyase